MIEIRTLENTSIEKITDAFNKAFLNYYFSIKFSRAQFEDKFATEGGRLDLSVGAFEKEKLVGFILHFIDSKNGKKYVYNGGTGVIESYRGNNLTAQMYDYIYPILKAENVDKMILEVLIENLPAISVYQKQGFKIQRELYCFNGKLNGSNSYSLDKDFKIVKIGNPDWTALQKLWDYEPTWQNSITTVKNLSEQKMVIGIEKNNSIIGYVIYNHKFNRIHQMAVSKEYRNIGLGTKLLNYIYNLESNSISFINIDTRMQEFKSFLEKRGLSKYTNQYEMEMSLK